VFRKRLAGEFLLGQLDKWEFLVQTFSASRLSLYLKACEGDERKAYELYLWNSDVSSAFWELLGHVEVALRNKISSQLQLLETRAGSLDHWLVHRERSSLKFNPFIEKAIVEAKTRVRLARKDQSGEQILSELSFGFWHQMLSKRNQRHWPDIAASFQGITDRNRTLVSNRLKVLRDFRNRIGHHHRIWNLDLVEKHQEILVFAHLLDPEFSIWLSGQSRITNLLSSRPI
jgi:hypothetical protein